VSKPLRIAIPEPYETTASLRASVMVMKEAVEILLGQRGDDDTSAVTWGDLNDELGTGIGSKVSKKGDTMTGVLTINSGPSGPGLQVSADAYANTFYANSQNGFYTLGVGGTNPYISYCVRGNPNWAYIYMMAIHYPGVWAGWYWDLSGAAINFRNGGSAFKPGGGPWSDSSDSRIKEVVGDHPHGLNEILALNPVVYRFKGNDTDSPPLPVSLTVAGALAEEHGLDIDDFAEVHAKVGLDAPYENSMHYDAAVNAKEYVGLIAQEVATVLPEMVTKRTGYIDGSKVDDLHDLDTASLIFTLINAVKELAARVETLEAANG
jgi:hypothetical protein